MPKTEKIELDPARTVEMDPRDPRAMKETWPCHGSHLEAKPAENKYALWIHCSRCELRIKYVPKKGAPANQSHSENPEMVRRALQELWQELPGELVPNQELVKVMIEKVTAEERMSVMLQDYRRMWDKNKKKVELAKEALGKSPNKGYTSQAKASAAPSTPTSWTAVEPASPEETDPLQFLTKEEKEQVMQIARRRAHHGMSETELEPNYN